MDEFYTRFLAIPTNWNAVYNCAELTGLIFDKDRITNGIYYTVFTRHPKGRAI